MDIAAEALAFATKAHAGQVRKYTGESYINHPVEVAEIVKTVPHTEAMIAAAYLHDVVEDCGVLRPEITARFGVDVSDLVYWLTDVSIGVKANRKERKAMDRAHIAQAPDAAKTIKLADLIDNTKTIASLDHKFWKVYKQEKIALLDALAGGDASLMEIAKAQVYDAL